MRGETEAEKREDMMGFLNSYEGPTSEPSEMTFLKLQENPGVHI